MSPALHFGRLSTSDRLRTSGSGFLGSFVVDKLRERGAVEIIVPRSQDCDLRDIQAIRQLFADVHNSAFRIAMMGVPPMHETWLS